MEMEVTPLGKIQNFDFFFFRVLTVSCEDCVVLFGYLLLQFSIVTPRGEKKTEKGID